MTLKRYLKLKIHKQMPRLGGGEGMDAIKTPNKLATTINLTKVNNN
jgi:hypothetical protein